mgnify:FL=1
MLATITGKTRLTGLLGRPVEHSISPMMHNEAFAQLELPYAYLCFDIGEEELPSAVEALKVLGARGWNCTWPDKNKMAELCDHLSPAARIIGAVNTVVNDEGVLTGHITDGTGYMMAVKDAGYDVIGKKMTMLGTGGAATAIIVQAALDGVSELAVFCRKSRRFYARTVEIVNRLNEQTACRVKLIASSGDYEEDRLREEIGTSYLLVNGTSVGMAPNVGQCLIKDPGVFHKNLVVSDIIYNPRMTRLLEMAKQAGCPVFNGLYMLLYQGAEAFFLWTGKNMPIPVIKEKYFS